MRKTFLAAKLHRAKVTQADLNYEGSFSIDEELLIRSGIKENEQVHVLNVTNGNRFITYAIKAAYGSRKICANGACAHLVNIGDIVIICTYTELDGAEIDIFKPIVLLLDEKNDYIVKEDYRDKILEKANEISKRPI